MNTRLYCEDCVLGLAARVEPESVDAVVTSPPYNLGIRYAGFRDDADRAAFLDWTLCWGRELRRVLKPRGALFLNVAGTPANPLLPHQLVLQFAEFFVLQNTIHWIKSITVEPPGGPPLSVGHFKPIRSPRYLNPCHEYLFHFTPHGETPLHRKAVGVPYADKANLARWQHTRGGADCRCRGNTWFIPYRTIHSRRAERPHPATYPVELPLQCLRLHGVGPQSVVLDPFLGLGNTALAAQQSGAGTFIGFETDPDYLAEARRRLEEAAPRTARAG